VNTAACRLRSGPLIAARQTVSGYVSRSGNTKFLELWTSAALALPGRSARGT
jgi:hypothetical protein